MSMDTETASNPERPNIQVDDLVRPMTDEEYAAWLEYRNTGPNPGRDGE